MDAGVRQTGYDWDIIAVFAVHGVGKHGKYIEGATTRLVFQRLLRISSSICTLHKYVNGQQLTTPLGPGGQQEGKYHNLARSDHACSNRICSP